MKLSKVTVIDLSLMSPSFRAVLENTTIGDRGVYGLDGLLRAILGQDTTETARALASLGVTRETFDAALKTVQGKVNA